ncbi:hypothetical protein I7I48_08491 [Histoplasma ohiense]|nr:hypothetical protein I7I48_08491 [Histoplasma ohiense (nom. inval.)]
MCRRASVNSQTHAERECCSWPIRPAVLSPFLATQVRTRNSNTHLLFPCQIPRIHAVTSIPFDFYLPGQLGVKHFNIKENNFAHATNAPPTQPPELTA